MSDAMTRYNEAPMIQLETDEQTNQDKRTKLLTHLQMAVLQMSDAQVTYILHQVEYFKSTSPAQTAISLLESAACEQVMNTRY